MDRVFILLGFAVLLCIITYLWRRQLRQERFIRDLLKQLSNNGNHNESTQAAVLPEPLKNPFAGVAQSSPSFDKQGQNVCDPPGTQCRVPATQTTKHLDGLEHAAVDGVVQDRSLRLKQQAVPIRFEPRTLSVSKNPSQQPPASIIEHQTLLQTERSAEQKSKDKLKHPAGARKSLKHLPVSDLVRKCFNRSYKSLHSLSKRGRREKCDSPAAPATPTTQEYSSAVVPRSELESQQSSGGGSPTSGLVSQQQSSAFGSQQQSSGLGSRQPSMKDQLQATFNQVAEQMQCRDGIIPAREISICCDADGAPYVLGEGGYGYVYRATLNGIQPVAVKVMKSLSDRSQYTHLLQEVALLRHLQHPHVVQYLGVAIDDAERLMLVTEFMAGGDLRSAIQRGMVDWARRGQRIALDIAMGLHFLHGRNVVHFDITSSNVLLTTTMQGKVADIGLARVAPQNSTQTVHGNYHYTAPELLQGTSCSCCVDMYSYGVVLWEIVTGEMPVRGKLRQPRVPQECPDVIKDLIWRCLDDDTAKRPKAEEVIAILQASKPSGGRAKLGKQMVLLERLGGLQAITHLTKLFYERMLDHDELRPFFKGIDMLTLVSKQMSFMCHLFGGAHGYRGKDLAEAHERLIQKQGLSQYHWYIMVGCLQEAMKEANVHDGAQQEVLENLGPTRDIFPESPDDAIDPNAVKSGVVKLTPVLMPPTTPMLEASQS